MTERGYGHAYFILQALQHFQKHLDYAFRLTHQETEKIRLSIDTIIQDFSMPDEDQFASGLAAYVSASLFIAGGASGATGIALRRLTKVRPSQLGPAKAELRTAERTSTAPNKGEPIPVDAAKAKVARIEKDIANLKPGGPINSAAGALIYLVAPVFALTVRGNEEPDGIVNKADLSEQVSLMYEASIERLERLVQIAVGKAGSVTDGNCKTPSHRSSHKG